MTDLHEMAYDLRAQAVNGLVTATYDSGELQLVDVMTHDGVTRTKIPVMQVFGFASNPGIGGVVLLIALGGDPANLRALPQTSSQRLGGLASGESVMYGADGSRFTCRANGCLEILAAQQVIVQAPAGVTVTGSITATGDISDAHGSMEAMRQVYNAHTHSGGAPPSPLMPD